MHFSIDFAPYIGTGWIWLIAGAAAVLVGYALWRRARGALARALAFAFGCLMLANPLIVRETREPLPDIVALVVDHSGSMDIDHRRAEADKAAAQIARRLSSDRSIEVRRAEVLSPVNEDTGTRLLAGVTSALADAPPERIAGAIAITDGEAHDAQTSSATSLHGPFHALIVGHHNERDRKLTVVSAARYAIVGQPADIVVRVDDFGSDAAGAAQVHLRVGGADAGTRFLPTARNTTIHIPVLHGGENVVEIEARPGPSELTLANNRAVVTIYGVRDRLRVLLISGQPHAGERVWRSLLKADPSVDLVHFTILRPPDKQDQTPIDQLSLIAFPTRELFVDKLEHFDLVIFDRYSELGILPMEYFENIAHYVEDGGALLVSSGPEFASAQSIFRTPLAAVLPAQPTGDVITQPFKPALTPAGQAHPVTRGLQGANEGNAPASWGSWFRIIGANRVAGETLMSGPDNRPLLVLDRVGKGRVAEILSDQGWLWARGFQGGGPQAELLRRLAHWLMKEPELEDERLSAAISGGQIEIDRQTLAATAKPVTLTYPSGRAVTLPLTRVQPGLWRASAKADQLGLYRATDGILSAVTASGPLNPKEVSDVRATGAILQPIAHATGGSVHWLADGGVPKIRRVGAGESSSGSNWIGLRANHAYRVTQVEQEQLLPLWLALLLTVGSLLLAWRMEGR
ncbi:MAG TPA: hypothetical protein VHY79_14885 [Rhizomicrobium sp.]|jgi:hypothetical protein|nr:hypothetical protein [Rhizomicrobium sp.]